jgi:hypothetical protein
VQCFRFVAWGFWFRVWDQGLWDRVLGSGVLVLGLGLRIERSGVQGSGFRVQGSRFWLECSRVHGFKGPKGLECAAQGTAFKVIDLRLRAE